MGDRVLLFLFFGSPLGITSLHAPRSLRNLFFLHFFSLVASGTPSSLSPSLTLHSGPGATLTPPVSSLGSVTFHNPLFSIYGNQAGPF